MKQKIRNMKSKNRSGFTLLECVISLLVISVIVFLLQIQLTAIKRVEDAKFKNNDPSYAYCQLNTFINSFEKVKIEKVNVESVVISVIKNNQENRYALESYKKMVRLRGMNGGHIPLLNGIKDVNFEGCSKGFLINYRNFENKKSQLFIKIGDKDVEKKKS